MAKESNRKKSFRMYYFVFEYSVFSQCCICRDVSNWKDWLQTIYHSVFAIVGIQDTFGAKINIFCAYFSPIHRELWQDQLQSSRLYNLGCPKKTKVWDLVFFRDTPLDHILLAQNLPEHAHLAYLAMFGHIWHIWARIWACQKILQNAVMMRCPCVNRTSSQKVITKSNIWPISP